MFLSIDLSVIIIPLIFIFVKGATPLKMLDGVKKEAAADLRDGFFSAYAKQTLMALCFALFLGSGSVSKVTF